MITYLITLFCARCGRLFHAHRITEVCGICLSGGAR